MSLLSFTASERGEKRERGCEREKEGETKESEEIEMGDNICKYESDRKTRGE